MRGSLVRKCLFLLILAILAGYWTILQAHRRRSKTLPPSLPFRPTHTVSTLAPSTLPLNEIPNADLANPGLLSSLFGSGCLNTKQGVQLLSDNYGAVCHRHDVNSDGCCARYIDRYSCKTCREELKCCESFEYCVSCCVKTRLSAGLVSVSEQTFRSCESDCRTSSGSTRHGNEYKHKFKHCYQAEKPSLKQLGLGANDTRLLPLPRPSISCKEACAALSPPHACSEELMEPLNTCDALKAHFPCEVCRSENRADTPSFLMEPRTCLTNEQALFDCNGRHPSTRRLCLCLNIDAFRR